MLLPNYNGSFNYSGQAFLKTSLYLKPRESYSLVYDMVCCQSNNHSDLHTIIRAAACRGVVLTAPIILDRVHIKANALPQWPQVSSARGQTDKWTIITPECVCVYVERGEGFLLLSISVNRLCHSGCWSYLLYGTVNLQQDLMVWPILLHILTFVHISPNVTFRICSKMSIFLFEITFFYYIFLFFLSTYKTIYINIIYFITKQQ